MSGRGLTLLKDSVFALNAARLVPFVEVHLGPRSCDRRPRSRTGCRSGAARLEAGLAELSEAGLTEEQARAADARHLPGQRALSDALFGGFARVVAARTVAA
jgi:hypothetical protein